VTVRFEPKASLEVTIEGYAGSGLEGLLSVTSSWPEAQAFETRQADPDPTGKASFALRGSKAIRVDLCVRRAKRLGDLIPCATTDVDVRAGAKSTVALRIPPLHSLEIEVPGAGGVTLGPSRFRLDEADWSEYLDMKEAGVARFERIPAAAYTVTFNPRGNEDESEMDLEVSGSTRVTFRAERRNAFVVRGPERRRADGIILESGGDARVDPTKLGLAAGDVWIGVDGAPFGDLGRVDVLRLAAGARGKQRLMIVRGGETRDVLVEARELFDAPGNFVPVTWPARAK
jgi:hypothetical protein